MPVTNKTKHQYCTSHSPPDAATHAFCTLSRRWDKKQTVRFLPALQISTNSGPALIFLGAFLCPLVDNSALFCRATSTGRQCDGAADLLPPAATRYFQWTMSSAIRGFIFVTSRTHAAQCSGRKDHNNCTTLSRHLLEILLLTAIMKRPRKSTRT